MRIAAHPARRGDNAALYIGLERPALAGPGRAGYGHILRAYREQGRKQHDLATPGPAPLSNTNSTLSRRIPAPPTLPRQRQPPQEDLVQVCRRRRLRHLDDESRCPTSPEAR